MKIKKLIIFCFLLIGCSSKEYINNQKMIDSINLLEFSETIIEAETDSIGNVLDTLSIEYLKYDEENKKRFRKKVYRYKDREIYWIDYFKPDKDLFYRETIDEDGSLNSIFETRSNSKGRVVEAIQISKERKPFDTVFMNYSYKFHFNGKIKELLINTFHKETGELISKTEYDEYEKPFFEMMIMKNDTMSFQIWEYMGTALKKSIYTNYQGDTSKSIYHFETGEILVNEEEYDFEDEKFVKSKEIDHFYNKANDRVKSIERNLLEFEVKFIKYIKGK